MVYCHEIPSVRVQMKTKYLGRFWATSPKDLTENTIEKNLAEDDKIVNIHVQEDDPLAPSKK